MNVFKDLNIDDLKNKYRCVVNGNQVVSINSNKKPVFRDCLKYAKKGWYTELFYTYESGKSILIYFWN